VGRRTIWIPSKLEAALDDAAGRAGVPFSSYVRRLLEVARHVLDLVVLESRGKV
jgi:hypothetical protein